MKLIINNFIKVSILIILASGTLFAGMHHLNNQPYNNLKKGDKVFLYDCDKFDWCKVKINNLYVRKHKFKKSGNGYVVKQNNHTHYYIKKRNGAMFGTYEKAEFDSNNIINLSSGQAYKNYGKNQTVKIESCDKFMWCKIKDKNLYVRGHQFIKKDNELILKRTYNIEYYVKEKFGDLFNSYSLYKTPNKGSKQNEYKNSSHVYNKNNLNITNSKQIQYENVRSKRINTIVKKEFAENNFNLQYIDLPNFKKK